MPRAIALRGEASGLLRLQVACVALGAVLAALRAVGEAVQRLDLDDGNRLVQHRLLPGHAAFEARQGELGDELAVVVPRAAGDELLLVARPLQHALRVGGGMQQREALAAGLARVDGVDAAGPFHALALGLGCQGLGGGDVGGRAFRCAARLIGFAARGE